MQHGFRPGRRPHDAMAEFHMLATNSYEWVLEGDIKACFDEIAHPPWAGCELASETSVSWRW